MSIKIFENAYSGNASPSIAINSDKVVSIYETDVQLPDLNAKPTKKGSALKLTRVTNIYTDIGATFQVRDKYLEVIARLNEKD